MTGTSRQNLGTHWAQRAAHGRSGPHPAAHAKISFEERLPRPGGISASGGRSRIRTWEGEADGFTDRSLWPLGQPAWCRLQDSTVKDSGPPACVWRTGGGHELPRHSRSSDGWHRPPVPGHGRGYGTAPSRSLGRQTGRGGQPGTGDHARRPAPPGRRRRRGRGLSSARRRASHGRPPSKRTPQR